MSVGFKNMITVHGLPTHKVEEILAISDREERIHATVHYLGDLCWQLSALWQNEPDKYYDFDTAEFSELWNRKFKAFAALGEKDMDGKMVGLNVVSKIHAIPKGKIVQIHTNIMNSSAIMELQEVIAAIGKYPKFEDPSVLPKDSENPIFFRSPRGAIKHNAVIVGRKGNGKKGNKNGSEQKTGDSDKKVAPKAKGKAAAKKKNKNNRTRKNSNVRNTGNSVVNTGSSSKGDGKGDKASSSASASAAAAPSNSSGIAPKAAAVKTYRNTLLKHSPLPGMAASQKVGTPAGAAPLSVVKSAKSGRPSLASMKGSGADAARDIIMNDSLSNGGNDSFSQASRKLDLEKKPTLLQG